MKLLNPNDKIPPNRGSDSEDELEDDSQTANGDINIKIPSQSVPIAKKNQVTFVSKPSMIQEIDDNSGPSDMNQAPKCQSINESEITEINGEAKVALDKLISDMNIDCAKIDIRKVTAEALKNADFYDKLNGMTERIKCFNEHFNKRRPRYEINFLERKLKQEHSPDK